MSTHNCQRCGGILKQDAANPHRFLCPYCGKEFSVAAAERETNGVREAFDESKQETLHNLRRMLYDAVTAPHISRADVKAACDAIRNLLPDDFLANFFRIASDTDARRLTAAIRDIDVDQQYEDIEVIITFLARSMNADIDCLLAINDLVERAFKTRDLGLFSKYATMVSEQAENVQAGVYETALPRDVFIAYSSRDMDQVYALVDVIEEQGLTCFVAARNLRHGVGSVENYDRALKEAMDNCRVFLFVSTMNSRNMNCDALKIEMNYIKNRDVENAPAQYRNNYNAIPARIKKPRLEFRVEESSRLNIADRITEQFFSGYEPVNSVEEVLEKLMTLLFDSVVTPTPSVETPPAEPIPQVQTQAQTPQTPPTPPPAPPAPAVEEEEKPNAVFTPPARNNTNQSNNYGQNVYTPPVYTPPQQNASDLHEQAWVYYRQKNYAEAARCFRQAAEMGYAKSQTDLGYCYENGLGLPQSYTDAVYWYRQAAEQNYLVAQFNLGVAYRDGHGTPQNDDEAHAWFRRAADQGYAKAQDAVGECYYYGRGVAKDFYEAVRWYRMAAEQNLPAAQYNLGYCYSNGLGLAKDYGEAARWFRKAAEQGHAASQCDLGFAYSHGRGVNQDYAEALRWYRKAADQGHRVSQNNIGECYYYGRGVAQDYYEATRWYRKAADGGNASSQFSLGYCYEKGQGLPQDHSQAVYWYRKAAEQGNASAQCNLGYAYDHGRGVPQDYNQAVYWYRKSAEQGHASAMCNLGYCYDSGHGVAQSYNEAVRWYRMAADKGHAGAQNNLGYCYDFGQGVPQSDYEAVRWYRAAAEQGHALAQRNLGLCYKVGQGVAKSIPEAVRWFRLAAEQGDEKSRQQLRELGYS